MPIIQAHSFLVHPGKKDKDQLAISGVAVPRRDMVFNMLSKLYEDADKECNIEIMFRHSADGRQENPCRDLMLAYVAEPSVPNGRALAERLQGVTTHRSGLGLLFLAVGDDRGKLLMVSRFPADQGVVAEEHAHRLEIAFLDRVFMKNAHTYKSALYAGPAAPGGFWHGLAVDKQITAQRELSNYWIWEFLESDLATTGPAGTKRLAVAVREAIKKKTTTPAAREELLAAARLMRGYDGRIVSAQGLADNLALGSEAVEAIKVQMPRSELRLEQFQFDRSEFDKHVMYRSIELDNGAVLTAEDSRFDEVFQKDIVSEREAVYSTKGSVVEERLRKRL